MVLIKGLSHIHQWNLETLNKYGHLTRLQKQFDRIRIVFSRNSVGTMEHPYDKN
jgi:hypothetical protein